MPEAEKAHGVLLALAQKAWESGVAKDMDSESLALLCWSTVRGIATLLTERIVPQENQKSAIKVGSMVVEALSAHLRGPLRD